MNSIIKNFSQFHSLNEEDSFWSNLAGSLGSGVKNVAVGQVTDWLTGQLGIKSDTFGGTIVRNMVQSLDLSDYPKFISGELNVRDMAPKLADATIATLSDMGVDGIATKLLKLEGDQKNGLIYKLVKELISNEASKREFRDNLVGIWTWVLGGMSSGSNQSSPFGAIQAQAASGSGQPSPSQSNSQSSSQSPPTSWDNILQSLTGGKLSSTGKGPVTGQ